MLNDEVSLGFDKERSTAITLRAGPLESLFKPRSAWVRQVRFGDREVVRATRLDGPLFLEVAVGTGSDFRGLLPA